MPRDGRGAGTDGNKTSRAEGEEEGCQRDGGRGGLWVCAMWATLEAEVFLEAAFRARQVSYSVGSCRECEDQGGGFCDAEEGCGGAEEDGGGGGGGGGVGETDGLSGLWGRVWVEACEEGAFVEGLQAVAEEGEDADEKVCRASETISEEAFVVL